MTDTHVCPRRAEVGAMPGSVFKVPETDTWREGGTCSWCGSLRPDEFMRQVREGCTVIPTDKNYKAYVRGEGMPQRKFYFQHLSAEQRTEFVSLLNNRGVNFATPGHFYVLPYFVTGV